MGVLVRGMEMPQGNCEWIDKDCHLHRCKLLNEYDDCKMQEGLCWYTTCEEQFVNCPLVEVPEEFGDLIDKEKLYERTAEWESQALNQVQKLMHRDDEEGKAEWRRWSAILNERTAFKHDVADAPVVIEGDN